MNRLASPMDLATKGMLASTFVGSGSLVLDDAPSSAGTSLFADRPTKDEVGRAWVDAYLRNAWQHALRNIDDYATNVVLAIPDFSQSFDPARYYQRLLLDRQIFDLEQGQLPEVDGDHSPSEVVSSLLEYFKDRLPSVPYVSSSPTDGVIADFSTESRRLTLLADEDFLILTLTVDGETEQETVEISSGDDELEDSLDRFLSRYCA